MIGGEMGYNAERFVDVRQIAAETPILFLDHQRRVPREGFAQNAEVGLRMASVLGPGKAAAESMPMYELGGPVFRLAAMPAAEARMWMTEAFAGGVLPWWHHIGSVHEDRRQYKTAEPLFRHVASSERFVARRSHARGDSRRRMVAAEQRPCRARRLRGRDRRAVRGCMEGAQRMGSRTSRCTSTICNVPATVRTVVLPEVAVMTDRQNR